MIHSQPAPADDRMARLQSLYAHGAPPHALCLIGSVTTGLSDISLHFAVSLLCRSQQNRPCGQCSACTRAAANAHANLLRLSLANKERTIKIDSLRKLLDALSLHPQESGPRVVIISDVQAMTVQAQNALLKSLEEPFAGDFFILTATVEQAVLPTIRSRCEMHRISESTQAYETAGTSAALSSQAHELAARTFFAVRTAADVPIASAELRGQKELQDDLLDLVEQQAMGCLDAAGSRYLSTESAWQQADLKAIRQVLSATLEARRYLGSNVSWQAVADRLLFTITKEIHQCPLS